MKPEHLQTVAAKRFLLVDGHAYAYRAFFAIRSLTSPVGQPVNAIYGFIKMLEKMIDGLRPTALGVIWDGGLDASRMAALPGYKAQRPPMPDSLSSQLDGITAYLRAEGIESFCQDGVEADDYLACLTWQGVAAGQQVVIASPDKDFMQLVSPQAVILNPGAKELALMGPAEVLEKTGVRPEQIVDWLSLIGDAVDNIPGVPGIGPKTATDLLRTYGSIQALYERLDEVSSERLRSGLAKAREAVLMNQGLIRLRADLECSFSEARFSRGQRDLQTLKSLFGEWGFRRMLADLDKEGCKTPELAFG